MQENTKFSKSSTAPTLILLGWLVYATSYLGKLNYSANITQIIDFYGVSKSQAGLIPTFFFFAYGIGQIVNGLLCKKYNIKWTVFCSLIISASINLTIAISTDFSVIKWLWMINGFALSMLWPTLIRMLSEALPKKALGTSSLVMGTTGATGTLVIYGLSSLFVAFGKFKYSFYTASFAVAAAAVLWLIFSNRLICSSKVEKAEESVSEEKKQTVQSDNGKKGEKSFFATIAILCFSVVGASLIKDGLTTWIPAILKEEFSVTDSLSILLTLLLPIVAIFGNAFALKVHKRIPDYIFQCAVVFAAIALLITAVIGSLGLEIAALLLVGLVAVNLLASSLTSLITSVFPLFMRDKVNSGLLAGVLNGFCYTGSAISSYGLGAIADGYGWAAVFKTLLVCCIAICLVCGGYLLTVAYKHQKNKKTQ